MWYSSPLGPKCSARSTAARPPQTARSCASARQAWTGAQPESSSGRSTSCLAEGDLNQSGNMLRPIPLQRHSQGLPRPMRAGMTKVKRPIQRGAGLNSGISQLLHSYSCVCIVARNLPQFCAADKRSLDGVVAIEKLHEFSWDWDKCLTWLVERSYWGWWRTLRIISLYWRGSKMKRPFFGFAAQVVFLAFWASSAIGQIYDAANQWSASSNPNGVWSYGWKLVR